MFKFILVILNLILLAGCFSGIPAEESIKPVQSDDYKKVEIPFTQYTRPTISEGYIYIPVNANDSELLNKIIKYNLVSKKYEVFFESPIKESTINNLMSNENWITWENSEITGANSVLYAYNKKNKQTKVVSRTIPDLIKINAPYLYDDILAWVDIQEGLPTLVLYDLVTDKKNVISTLNHFSFYNNFVHINNDVLIWTDSIDNKGYYYYYDLKNKTISRDLSEFPYPGYAKLISHRVFGIHFTDYLRWTQQKFGYYDKKDQRFYPLSQSYINSFAVSNKHLAVLTEKQSLEVYSVNDSGVHQLKIPHLNTHIDTIDFVSDGSLIAGYTDFNSKKIILFLLTLP